MAASIAVAKPVVAVKGCAPKRAVAAAALPEANRRAALSLLVGAATLTLKEQPALAAYGQTANVFGRVTNSTGFIPYAGDDFAVLLPSKWNPSKEDDFARFGLKTALRYEDNFDAVNTLMVLTQKASGSSVKDYGSPEEFLKKFGFLLGQQSFSGETISEGGFAPNRVSAASVLGLEEVADKKGRPTYRFNILSRTADGDEGGRHQLISATVANGQLYILKIQAGDKRWFKGVKADAEGSFNSFTIV